ncbi:uncharacterized protein (TIGR04222 family) [Streptomyces olivoverticillatus]|uniref:Uncharacterized protein (TIGR04222 family) n=1 Tax=Streptomyces olivoverticillatus TaxID=66427 RepID=A0A7W7LPL8_9ACTN|nr:TIGR04222 domain-containing membrane protein [Streptomyces olivoverticillatus]MBB4893461.1 uncharacterized protein (TIGR04222 family) [Streptomyces olivoverticillatus]
MTAAFIVALTALCVLSAWLIGLRLQAHGPRGPFDDLATQNCHRLDLWGIAYLMGGRDRVADTLIVKTYADGRIGMDDRGKINVIDARADSAEERAVLRHCGSEWNVALKTLRGKLRSDPLSDLIENRLSEPKLFLSERTMRTWRIVAGFQVAAIVVAAGTSLGMLLHSGSDHRPFALVIAAALGIALRAFCSPSNHRQRMTEYGEKAQHHLRSRSPWGRQDPDLHPAGLAGAVAVFGTAVIPDRTMRHHLENAARSNAISRSRAARRRASSTSSTSSCGGATCSSYSSCSSTSSCSGGSSSCSSSSCSSSSCGGGSSCS